MNKLSPSFVVGFSSKMEDIHFMVAMTMIVIKPEWQLLAVGIALIGCGWTASRRVWERVEYEEFKQKLRGFYKNV